MSKWTILAALFFARAGMGFQYQTVASSVVPLRGELGLSMDQIGVLIGVYFLLGIPLALPGGAIGARFGSKRAVLAGLLLMAIGGVLAAQTLSFGGQVAARVLAGSGGVMLNVMMSKMVVDLFDATELATAMGVFVSSWTFGVAVALVSIPSLTVLVGLPGVLITGAGWALLGFGLVALVYPATRGAPSAAAGAMQAPRGAALRAVILAGMVWGLFNAGFATIFGFGPAALIEGGASNANAGFLISLVLWTTLLSVPLGGLIADRAVSPRVLIFVSPACAALVMIVAPGLSYPALGFILLGLIIGIPAGPIMALPSQVLAPERRAVGMGVFFTVFYLVMVLAPVVAGWISAYFGAARAGYDASAVYMLLGLVSYGAFLAAGRGGRTPDA